MTLKDTPTIVTASGVAGLEFTDEVQTANALVPVLRRRASTPSSSSSTRAGSRVSRTWVGPDGKPYKVETRPTTPPAAQGRRSSDPTSPIIPIAEHLDPAIDMIVSGHTHAAVRL